MMQKVLFRGCPLCAEARVILPLVPPLTEGVLQEGGGMGKGHAIFLVTCDLILSD